MRNIRFTSWRQERGVTLIELLAVVAIMAVVVGGIVAVLNSLYSTYRGITDNSQNERTALMIENDITQDLRHALKTTNGVQIDLSLANRIVILNPQQIQLIYDTSGGQIKYQTVKGAWVTLATDGTLKVTPPSSGSNVYNVWVRVGSGASQAVVQTTVAPYDWGK